MTTNIDDIDDGGLPRVLSGLGQTSTGRVFDDGAGTVSVLQQGVKAPRQVKQMQLLLNKFGYKLAVDGIFGAGSVAAVKAVQNKLNMKPTGVYDKALDERIVGMNQSGIIDATASDVRAVSSGQAQLQTTSGLLPPPKPGNGLVVGPPAPTYMPPSKPPPDTSMLPGGSFMDKVKAKWAMLQADPNFKYYAAGGVVVAAGGLFLLTMPKAAPPRTSQMSGYGPFRTVRVKKKGAKAVVNLDGDEVRAGDWSKLRDGKIVKVGGDRARVQVQHGVKYLHFG